MANLLRLAHNPDQFDNEFSGAEVLLPAQVHKRCNSATTLEPLRRLMVAVLVDAIRCVQSRFDARQPAGRQKYADSWSRIFSDDYLAVFFFKAICGTLDRNLSAIRKYLVLGRKQA